MGKVATGHSELFSAKIGLYSKDTAFAVQVSRLLEAESIYHFEVAVINNQLMLQKVIGRKKYQLILLDLPVLDEAVCAWVESLAKALPPAALIVIGGQADPRVELRLLQAGIDDYWIGANLENIRVHVRIYNAIEKHKLRMALAAETKGYESLVSALLSGKVNTIDVPAGKVRIVDAKAYAEKESYIEKLRLHNQQLLELANKDSLTNLPNRRQFEQTMVTELARAKRHKRLLVLYSMDLDEFKSINDTFGHHVGDLLLIEVAKRLRDNLWEGDFIARIGGDEFAVIVATITHPYVAREIALKLLAAVGQRYILNGKEVHVSVSIGVTTFPGGGEDVEGLCKSADLAMYNAKKSGRNTYHFFSGNLENSYAKYLQIKHALSLAVEHQELSLMYQPQVDMVTGQVRAIEVLLRWKNAELGEISPAEFIPIAEESGLIVPVGEWVIKESIERYASWHSRWGASVPRLAINVSPVQLQKDLPRLLQNYMLRHNILPECIEVELTETAVMRYSRDSAGALEKLHRLGVSIVVDDFGTGYSSLSHLRQLPISVLKIDQSFVRDIESQASAGIIVKTMIVLAKNLGLEVVAEGVETRGQVDFLLEKGCHYGQGYHFCRPLNFENMSIFIEKLQS